MADNVAINAVTTPGGATIATDEIGGVQHELVKVEFGTDGNATMVSAADPLPVTDAAAASSLASIDGKLTNPLPVSGTVAVSSLPAGLATSANQQTDALTDAELRASAVPVSLAAVPLATGAATATKQDEQTVTLQDLYNMLLFAVDRMEFGLATDLAKRLKVNLVDSGALASVTAVGTVTTVSTVSSLTNTVRQGDLQMGRVNEALLDTAFILGIQNNITF